MSDHASLLPPNATSTERAVEQATARISDVPAPLRELWNPQTCPVELLPWLAWALSIDNWQSDWPEYIKRSRIATAIEIQRHKGTVKAVKDTVASFGGAVDVVEWWEKTPKGVPHTFDLTLTLSGNDGETATAQFVNDVITEVDKVKPVRSHYTFTQGVALFGSEGTAPYARALVFARLELTEDTN
jgi:phage tail P2-like protein